MKNTWENNGEPNEAGEYVAVLTPEPDKGETGGEQRFIGKTHKEVADKLLDAQMNSTQKIRELTSNAPLDQKKTAAAAEPMTADKRFEIGAGLQDPSKAPEAIVEAVEAQTGVHMADVKKLLDRDALAEKQKEIFALQQEWLKENPEFFGCSRNERLMNGYLDAHNAAVTKKNLDIAFRHLKDSGLLVFAPENAEVVETETPPTPAAPAPGQPGGLPAAPAVTTRPRTVHSTGVRSTEMSGTATPPAPAQKYTWAQVDRMGKTEYAEKYATDPAFKAFVDAPAAAR